MSCGSLAATGAFYTGPATYCISPAPPPTPSPPSAPPCSTNPHLKPGPPHRHLPIRPGLTGSVRGRGVAQFRGPPRAHSLGHLGGLGHHGRVRLPMRHRRLGLRQAQPARDADQQGHRPGVGRGVAIGAHRGLVAPEGHGPQRPCFRSSPGRGGPCEAWWRELASWRKVGVRPRAPPPRLLRRRGPPPRAGEDIRAESASGAGELSTPRGVFAPTPSNTSPGRGGIGRPAGRGRRSGPVGLVRGVSGGRDPR
jgi:hypothetical protein